MMILVLEILKEQKDVQLHQEMNRAASMAYATLTGATVKLLKITIIIYLHSFKIEVDVFK